VFSVVPLDAGLSGVRFDLFVLLSFTYKLVYLQKSVGTERKEKVRRRKKEIHRNN
jgi:hypothetical protein